MTEKKRVPEGARRTRCPECGWTYGTHAPDCDGESHAKSVLEQMRLKLQGGPCFLIECGARYYCGPGDWCDNPEHAHRYAAEEQALEVSRHMNTLEERRVVKHIW